MVPAQQVCLLPDGLLRWIVRQVCLNPVTFSSKHVVNHQRLFSVIKKVNMSWRSRDISGCGVIFSWTVTHRPLHRGFADAIPYAPVIVELEEGLRIVSDVPAIPPAELAIDLPVEVEIEPAEDGLAIHHFRPKGSG